MIHSNVWITNPFGFRPHEGKGLKFWEILCKKIKNVERRRLQQLILKSTSLRLEAKENKTGHITRAEHCQVI